MTVTPRSSNFPSLPERSNCHDAQPLMEAFVDGELSPDQTLEIEAHVDRCERCQANVDFLRTLSSTVKEIVNGHETVTDGSDRLETTATPFMMRLEKAIEAEIELETERTEALIRGAWLGKVTIFAAAASATLWFGVRALRSDTSNVVTAETIPAPAAHLPPAIVLPADAPPAVPAPAVSVADSKAPPAIENEVLTLEGALDRLIDYHSSPPKPQVTSAELLGELEPDVGVRMQLPKLNAQGARWEGASLVPVRNERAASFRYKLPKNRVTLYVFNASRLRVHDSDVLARGTQDPVYFGQWRGYNVAAKENRGVGYALATDMDGPAVAQMINDVH